MGHLIHLIMRKSNLCPKKVEISRKSSWSPKWVNNCSLPLIISFLREKNYDDFNYKYVVKGNTPTYHVANFK